MKEKEENSNLDLQRYEAEYSERGLFDKLSSVAKKAGLKVVYYALILYYALQSPKISVKEKALIIGALGYFILERKHLLYHGLVFHTFEYYG